MNLNTSYVKVQLVDVKAQPISNYSFKYILC